MLYILLGGGVAVNQDVGIKKKSIAHCAGSHAGAQRAAVFYSLFACCKLNEVDPVEWLEDIMIRLPEHPVNHIEELLPHLWEKKKQAEEEGVQV